MAQTESTMPALGLAAANFHLPDVVSGATVGLDSFAGKRALLVMFISRHCPYVQHVKHELARLGKDYAGEALGIVAISPNYVVQYPDDAPELLKEMAAELGLNYPICYDETQEAAKAYDAACTPDFFRSEERRVGKEGRTTRCLSDWSSDVCSSDLKEMAAELGLNYPICYDETQEAAKAYDAACTPDFF